MAVVLVTGGAGYVGSHACKALAAAGHQPVSFDNMHTGWQDAVQFGPLVRGDLLEPETLDAALTEYKPAAIMHFAALSNVPVSAGEPGLYWQNNVAGSLNLLKAAEAHGVHNVVFSSTCAIFGAVTDETLSEEHPQAPVNVYGRTKLAVEAMLGDFQRAHGIRPVIFRYFNAAGADPAASIGEDHRPEFHLIPLVLDAASGRRASITIFGTDYPTPDGTCIRDYIHVSDLADAHVRGIEWLLRGGEPLTLNLGSGSGYSVREVIETASEVTGVKIPIEYGTRRVGDPPRLVSGSTRAREVLGWTCERSDLVTMISDAWRWHQRGGYAC